MAFGDPYPCLPTKANEPTRYCVTVTFCLVICIKLPGPVTLLLSVTAPDGLSDIPSLSSLGKSLDSGLPFRRRLEKLLDKFSRLAKFPRLISPCVCVCVCVCVCLQPDGEDLMIEALMSMRTRDPWFSHLYVIYIDHVGII